MDSLLPFLVGLLHPLQHAGLTRRTLSSPSRAKWGATVGNANDLVSDSGHQRPETVIRLFVHARHMPPKVFGIFGLSESSEWTFV
jgi:hypothetical protein